MATATQSALVSTKMLWAGRIVCGFVVLFLLMDSGMKVMKVAPAMRGTVQLGYSVSLVPIMGIILSACTALYAIPRTCVLGAILLTGYLGGAVASQWRIGEPLFSGVLFPVYFGVLLWGGLYLRDKRLRALVPLRSQRGGLAQ